MDEQKRVIGIISLSDILTYIILKQDEQSKEQLTNKTASLTAAFGLTKLNSMVDPSQITLNTSNFEAINNIQIGSKVCSSNNSHLNDSNISSNSRTSSPLQQQSACVDQAIFEDDPMETEPLK